MSTSWTLFNGTAQGVSLGRFAIEIILEFLFQRYFSQVFEPNWVRNPLFIVGLILFFVGMYVNCQADDILINLRKPGDKGNM